MKTKIDKRVPRYPDLIMPTYLALKELGGSGTNEEINTQIIKDLKLPDEIVDISHLGSSNMTEIVYQAAWARTYLKNYGVISNSARSVWSINPDYVNGLNVDGKDIVKSVNREAYLKRQDKKYPQNTSDDTPAQEEMPEINDIEYPEEVKPWREKLSFVLHHMDPYAFERLAQRVLRECGFTQVEVTKGSGDGGIDGTGKLKINGIFSFKVAFQCKRYQGVVGAGAIRDFRGSLTQNIEKGVLITTGTFSQAAKEEASDPGKKQIDLIDGEEFINKIAEFGIGVKEIKSYEIDEEFFNKI